MVQDFKDIKKIIKQKGWRPYDEAVKDDKYLRDHARTGDTWGWINQYGHIVQGTELS